MLITTEHNVTIPLYSYDNAFQGFVPARRALQLERDGLARVVRKRTGKAVRAIMHKRAGDPEVTTVRDYMGKAYSFKHHLDDGHTPWSLKPLTGRVCREDQSVEYHLAPESLRPIFIRVLLDCVVQAG